MSCKFLFGVASQDSLKKLHDILHLNNSISNRSNAFCGLQPAAMLRLIIAKHFSIAVRLAIVNLLVW